MRAAQPSSIYSSSALAMPLGGPQWNRARSGASSEYERRPGERGYSSNSYHSRQSSDEILESIPFEEGASSEDGTDPEDNSSSDEEREEDLRGKSEVQQLGQMMAGSTLAQTTREEESKSKVS